MLEEINSKKNTFVLALGTVLFVAAVTVFIRLDYQDAVLATALDSLVEETATLRQELVVTREMVVELAEKNRLLEEQLGVLESDGDETLSALSQLESDLATERETEANQMLSSVVAVWQSRVARIECNLYNEEGDLLTSAASGVATYINGQLYFISNKHLVEEEGAVLDECFASLPQRNIKDIHIDDDDVVVSEGRDLAYLLADKPGVAVSVVPDQRACSVEPRSGDEIITLGFPRVGSEDSVTVTEGIISGQDDGYYVTSAKIERGNSGGAAVHVEQGCFLGLPTVVAVGRIESLARILPVSSLTQFDL